MRRPVGRYPLNSRPKTSHSLQLCRRNHCLLQAKFMKVRKRLTRKQAIEAHCRSCVYDPSNAGTWRQQVTLCACRDCFLWEWRPVSNHPLPEPLLKVYGVTDAEKLALQGRKSP